MSRILMEQNTPTNLSIITLGGPKRISSIRKKLCSNLRVISGVKWINTSMFEHFHLFWDSPEKKASHLL
jgi:hypothetical protein